MKRVWGLILAMLLIAMAGCGTNTGRDMPVLQEDQDYDLGTYTFTVPAGWYISNSSSDDTTLYFYPPEGDGMLSLAISERIDLMDPSQTALFLSGYAASKEGLEEIATSGVAVGVNTGLVYQYYDLYDDITWYNTLYLMDAGDCSAAILITYPKDASDDVKAQFDAVLDLNGLADDEGSEDVAPIDTSVPDQSTDAGPDPVLENNTDAFTPVYNAVLSEYITSEMEVDFSTTSWYRRIVAIEVYDDPNGSHHLEIIAVPIVSDENQTVVAGIIDVIREQQPVDGSALIDILEDFGIPAYIFLSEASGMTESEVKYALETGGVPGDVCAEVLEDYIGGYELGGLERIAYTIKAVYLDDCTYAEFRYDTDDVVLRVDF